MSNLMLDFSGVSANDNQSNSRIDQDSQSAHSPNHSHAIPAFMQCLRRYCGLMQCFIVTMSPCASKLLREPAHVQLVEAGGIEALLIHALLQRFVLSLVVLSENA